jgi:hypothetical protein
MPVFHDLFESSAIQIRVHRPSGPPAQLGLSVGPYITVRSVVVGWRQEVPGEPRTVVLAVEQAVGQRMMLSHQYAEAGGCLTGPGQGSAAEQADLRG